MYGSLVLAFIGFPIIWFFCSLIIIFVRFHIALSLIVRFSFSSVSFIVSDSLVLSPVDSRYFSLFFQSYCALLRIANHPRMLAVLIAVLTITLTMV